MSDNGMAAEDERMKREEGGDDEVRAWFLSLGLPPDYGSPNTRHSPWGFEPGR